MAPSPPSARAVAIFLAILTASAAASPPPAPPSTSIEDNLNFQKNLPAKVVWAAPGMDADLPCDVSPPKPNDRVNMVLWFKDTEGVPLYSLDNRNGDLEKAEHGAISRPRAAKGRYFFLTSASGVPLPPSGPRVAAHNRVDSEGDQQLPPMMARLRILNVSQEDEGVFRCRVDFLNSPTTNSKVNLTLATAPSSPVILNANGVEVGASAGPFLEGYDLQLSCSVTGGHPRPVVTWWLGDTLLDDTLETKAPSETVNRLRLPAVTREHHGAVLQCRAAPLPGAPAQRRDVALDVYLKPKRVQIVTPLELVPAGQPQQVLCESSGSVPAADITWLLNGEPLSSAAVSVVSVTADDRHVTSSTLTLKAAAEHNSQELACRAENPRFPGGFQEDRRRLKVAYPPVVSISLASEGPVADELKVGDEVRLRCDVNANPPAYKVTWYQGNTVLRQDSNDRRFLIIRNVSPSSAGQYACAAANKEGTGVSEAITLKVKYSPRCREGYVNRRMGAIKGQMLEVRCEVLAEPAGADVKFSWTFNRSRDVTAVPTHKVMSNGTVSKLFYTPNKEEDFGTLACWASNSIGQQTIPCYVHVVHAHTPQPPESCSVRNRTSAGAVPELEVKCVAGADGGLRQHFLLELYETTDDGGGGGGGGSGDPGDEDDKSNEVGGEALSGRREVELEGSGQEMRDTPASATRGQPLRRVQGPDPSWVLPNLEPGQRYEILLYAVNDKGPSNPPVTLRATAPQSQEYINGVELRGNMMGRPPLDALSSGASSSAHQAAPVAVVLGVLIACATLILGAVVLAVVLVVCRRRREARREAEEARRRDDFREAVRDSQQVVVGSLKRQPVTPGEEDQFGILVTATSPNSSVVGIRDGGSGPGMGAGAANMGTLVRGLPAGAAAAAARALGSQHVAADDPRRLSHHGDPGSMPPMTIVGCGGGVLNRIRNNNDPDLIVPRAEVVLKPLNTSRC